MWSVGGSPFALTPPQEAVTPIPEEDWANPWGDEDGDSSGGDSGSDDVAGEDDSYMWDEDSFLSAMDTRNEYEDRLEVLADLDEHGQQLVVAQGGKAGMGNRSMPRWEQKPDVRRARPCHCRSYTTPRYPYGCAV